MSSSPFLEIPIEQWTASNALAFAVLDGFPVSPGHTLVITKRLVATWFEASAEEQAAVMALVSEVKSHLDRTLDPKPTGYNVGFNSGESAGQTVMHLHVHVIPRYSGDIRIRRASGRSRSDTQHRSTRRRRCFVHQRVLHELDLLTIASLRPDGPVRPRQWCV